MYPTSHRYGHHLFCIVWENVYGFNMKTIQRVALQEPLVDLVEARQVTTGPYLLKVSHGTCTDYFIWAGYILNDCMCLLTVCDVVLNETIILLVSYWTYSYIW